MTSLCQSQGSFISMRPRQCHRAWYLVASQLIEYTVIIILEFLISDQKWRVWSFHFVVGSLRYLADPGWGFKKMGHNEWMATEKTIFSCYFFLVPFILSSFNFTAKLRERYRKFPYHSFTLDKQLLPFTALRNRVVNCYNWWTYIGISLSPDVRSLF